MSLSPKPPHVPSLAGLLTRADALLARIEALLPEAESAPDWGETLACRWRNRQGGQGQSLVSTAGRFVPVRHVYPVRLADLVGIDAQKARIVANTRQFVQGYAANNVLLTGARGCGKSSLVKALLHEFSGEGLRLIEIDKDDLTQLTDVVDQIADRPEKFILFCDDLSFEAGEVAYKALKSALDGSIAAPPDNLLIYATSNRRHLLPEYFSENLEGSRSADGEIHPGEAMEEKVSLSDRFGLWISFYPCSQEEYLAIVARWLTVFGFSGQVIKQTERDALNWALSRGSRSGRVARQFALDFAGQSALAKPQKPTAKVASRLSHKKKSVS